MIIRIVMALVCLFFVVSCSNNEHVEWFEKGKDHYMSESYDEAIKCFDKSIELKPDYAEAWYNKGFALADLGKEKEAQECFTKYDELKAAQPVAEEAEE